MTQATTECFWRDALLIINWKCVVSSHFALVGYLYRDEDEGQYFVRNERKTHEKMHFESHLNENCNNRQFLQNNPFKVWPRNIHPWQNRLKAQSTRARGATTAELGRGRTRDGPTGQWAAGDRFNEIPIIFHLKPTHPPKLLWSTEHEKWAAASSLLTLSRYSSGREMKWRRLISRALLIDLLPVILLIDLLFVIFYLFFFLQNNPFKVWPRNIRPLLTLQWIIEI